MLYLCFHTDVYWYETLCVAAIKPLYTLLVRDSKHTWNSHINMLFITLPWLKNNAGKFLEKSLFN